MDKSRNNNSCCRRLLNSTGQVLPRNGRVDGVVSVGARQQQSMEGAAAVPAIHALCSAHERGRGRTQLALPLLHGSILVHELRGVFLCRSESAEPPVRDTRGHEQRERMQTAARPGLSTAVKEAERNVCVTDMTFSFLLLLSHLHGGITHVNVQYVQSSHRQILDSIAQYAYCQCPLV